MSNCSAGVDTVQDTVAPGAASYTVPVKGTITSWSTIVVPPAGVRGTLKVFRRTPVPTLFQAVGHAGPEAFNSLGVLSFPASIRVEPGDLLGLHAVDTLKCALVSQASLVRFEAPSDIADGQTGTLGDSGPGLLAVQATVVPDNSFSRSGKVKLNEKKGTATATFNLPNPGDLTGSGKGAKSSSASAVASKNVPAGPAKLKIRAKGSKLATLNRTGKVTLKLTITYTPTGGDPNRQKLKVNLLKR